jgi:hypothetical protein
MTAAATSLLCLAMTSIGLLLQSRSFGDTPLPPPTVREVWSANRRFVAKMEPKTETTVVYRVETDGKRTRQWTMHGWFRVASLADDGEHLVAGHGGINLLPLSVTRNEPMIRFFKRGELIATVTLGDLIKDQRNLKRTASHLCWGNYLGLDEKGRYTVETVERKILVFDVTTGKPWKRGGEHTAAETKAADAAKAWLALVDQGKYEESWDAAVDSLRNRVSKDNFVQSLAAARKPLGRLKSRELASTQYELHRPPAPAGEFVFVEFKTAFENKESAGETVAAMLGSDGKWKVSGYYVK